MPLLWLVIKDLYWSLLAPFFLCSCHVLQMFQPSSLWTAAVTTCIKHCKQWKLLVPGGKNRCTHNKVWLLLFFFCLQISTSVSSLIMWKMCINVALLRGSIQQKTVTFIQPYVSLRESRRAGGSHFCHASVMLLSHHV